MSAKDIENDSCCDNCAHQRVHDICIMGIAFEFSKPEGGYRYGAPDQTDYFVCSYWGRKESK